MNPVLTANQNTCFNLHIQQDDTAPCLYSRLADTLWFLLVVLPYLVFLGETSHKSPFFTGASCMVFLVRGHHMPGRGSWRETGYPHTWCVCVGVTLLPGKVELVDSWSDHPPPPAWTTCLGAGGWRVVHVAQGVTPSPCEQKDRHVWRHYLPSYYVGLCSNIMPLGKVANHYVKRFRDV